MTKNCYDDETYHRGCHPPPLTNTNTNTCPQKSKHRANYKTTKIQTPQKATGLKGHHYRIQINTPHCQKSWNQKRAHLTEKLEESPTNAWQQYCWIRCGFISSCVESMCVVVVGEEWVWQEVAYIELTIGKCKVLLGYAKVNACTKIDSWSSWIMLVCCCRV